MNYEEFTSCEKSLLIAPAGFGKTHALAESLTYISTPKKQLILTHTHAGIASLKEKIKKLKISSAKFHIETISGFTQKYVLAFCCTPDLPAQEEKKYFNIINEKANELFKLKSVQKIITDSYSGLFVDEYQDCTKKQHEFIMLLSDLLSTHLLGDPMQGIFGFNDVLVDFNSDLDDFKNKFVLEIPWRWNKEGNNQKLGNVFKDIRTILESQKEIIVTSFSNIEFHTINEKDFYNPRSLYRVQLDRLIRNYKKHKELESLLIIVPEYSNEKNIRKGGISDRAQLKAQIDYSNQLTLLEAIDDKSYYSLARTIDETIQNIHKKIKKIKFLTENIFEKLFNASDISVWINDNRVKEKKEPDKNKSHLLKDLIEKLINEPSPDTFLSVIVFFRKDLKLKTKRSLLLTSIIKSIDTAIADKISVYEAMLRQKNIVRRVGRKVHGKCLGTPLLTKGLEFDTVIILNAHRFDDHKHFYVAITRACKRLIVFSENATLTFK